MIPAPSPAESGNPHLAAALAAVSERLPPARVDQVWIFPAHARGPKESGLAVLAVFADAPADPRRTLFTVRYDAEPGKGGVQRADLVQEEGTVPHDRLDRLVDGVVRRLGGGTETPEVHEVGGDDARWAELLAELAGG